MRVAFLCCLRQGVARMSRDLGQDVPDLEKLYARKLWADFPYPKRLKNFKIALRDWIFKRDWKFPASHPPNPYFLWGFLKVRIEIFNRDWFCSSEIDFVQARLIFSIFGPLGWWTSAFKGRRPTPYAPWSAPSCALWGAPSMAPLVVCP